MLHQFSDGVSTQLTMNLLGVNKVFKPADASEIRHLIPIIYKCNVMH